MQGKQTRTLSFQQVDVFSSHPLRGNPLAVVMDADDLPDAQMAAFANWTNLSETTFLLRPQHPEADYRVRIFTPQTELPFAGHPTLGSCHAWLVARGEGAKGDIVQECAAGLIRVRKFEDGLAFAAPPLVRQGDLEPALFKQILSGLHLSPEDVVAAQWVDNGPGWLALLLKSRRDVLALKPDFRAISGIRVGVCAPWHPDEDGREADFEVRAFTAAGFEDPVTGSLNAGIARWLIGSGIAGTAYIAAQGTVLGREGRVRVVQDSDAIWIGGNVSTCITGTVSF
ncbi:MULTISPECIES: PhzF family phenazine biosynthesis protein [Rhizobium]|uniref:Phenazine biosynthesis protein PhzF family n=1 Tax=Rhizobium miluonense TaxID=411945 RepID=A0A1C3WHM0_9HYPH|nr:PhzF family phenazine biosynthesis protein [Rhizobium miluonense]SCB39562.1 phenazine biosynthesis protein PhzF family [Rhizobium miluonense]